MKLERLLFVVGIVCLGLYVGFTVQSHLYQSQMEETFDAMVQKQDSSTTTTPPPPPDRPQRVYKEGELVGRLAIPRLDLSVMVLEGIGSRTLRLGAGHIPGTPIPGRGSNAGIAAHRDSFFRSLSGIKENDVIEFRTPDKTVSYKVVGTQIVTPEDVDVLKPAAQDTLTLVTCYPFYYIGPAPKRFIVKAVADPAASASR